MSIAMKNVILSDTLQLVHHCKCNCSFNFDNYRLLSPFVLLFVQIEYHNINRF